MISTHHIEGGEILAERMVVMREGKVVYSDETDVAKDSHRFVPPSLIGENDKIVSKIDGEFLV